ncbi:MAG: hypothetical protein KA368_21175 [Acidobacteria bacterium]|nr:hypothetical protein [Acidobacteriota bacterium]
MHGKTNKIKGIIMAAMLIGAAVIWNYGHQNATAQQRPAPAPQNIAVQPIAEEQVSEAELRTIRKNPKILEATEMLAAQGEELDFGKTKALKYPQPAPNEKVASRPRVIIIIIIIKPNARLAAGQKPEFGKLVYEKGTDGKELVYFDEPTGSKPVAQNDADNAKLGFGCGAWSAWSETGRDCRNTFFTCMLQNQQGSFVSYRRERQCKRGVQVQTRTVRLRCGC